MSEIEKSLKQRGHEVIKEGVLRDLLLPRTNDAVIVQSFKEILYRMMSSDGLRKSIRNWAYGGTVHEEHEKRINAYSTLCLALSDRSEGKFIDKQRQGLYAASFEWYISELFKREFGARSSGHGIRLWDADPRDEFDCIALLDKGLAYVECKTGKGHIYEEMETFARRDEEISANYSIYLFDRDYTFQKGPEDLPTLTASQAERLNVDKIEKISNNYVSFFIIEASARSFIASTSFDGLEDRIRHVIRYYDILADAASGGDDEPGERLARSYKITPINFDSPASSPESTKQG